ncbi:MAG: hypothetical protein VX278_19330, partial [Myxococcota bacterium]|nr:hypothetical protein [Myxococcota bacterium]
MLTYLFMTVFQAQAASYYSFDNIAKNSELFKKAAEISGGRFDDMQSELNKANTALKDLEIGTALLNQKELIKWESYCQNEIQRQFASIQNHSQTLQSEFSSHFKESAMAALKSFPNAKVCKKNPNPYLSSKPCEGNDVSKEIAKKMDADQKLVAAIQALQDRDWPTLTIPQTEIPMVEFQGSKYKIQIDVLSYILKENVKKHKMTYESQYSQIASVIDTDPNAREKATLFYDDYKQNMKNERQTLEKAIKAFLKKARRKDKRFLDIGFCGNPVDLGGCPGEDLTQETLDWLLEHKKSRNILKKA